MRPRGPRQGSLPAPRPPLCTSRAGPGRAGSRGVPSGPAPVLTALLRSGSALLTGYAPAPRASRAQTFRPAGRRGRQGRGRGRGRAAAEGPSSRPAPPGGAPAPAPRTRPLGPGGRGAQTPNQEPEDAQVGARRPLLSLPLVPGPHRRCPGRRADLLEGLTPTHPTAAPGDASTQRAAERAGLSAGGPDGRPQGRPIKRGLRAPVLSVQPRSLSSSADPDSQTRLPRPHHNIGFERCLTRGGGAHRILLHSRPQRPLGQGPGAPPGAGSSRAPARTGPATLRPEGAGRGRKRETSVCGCLSCSPHWGPGPQLRHVP
ncbi:translation initiation factor IF-2-like isoform X2 [Artibeus jamaicensis]|uniref:translation initiation factor IF-2-like isoform X2 n=1 Tax=Artibeus jamaicensis TaxID=9417 RepID=UPI00235A9F4B|nr:translation initiation factor IF-2-like isoform X2 [Artibeus jamaicensis]